MSITEDAPAAAPARRSHVRLPGPARRASPWWLLVAASALLLIGLALVMGVWWAASSTTRIVAPSRVIGTLSAVELDLGAAPVEITGGAGGAVEVSRAEEYAYGRRPTVTRRVDAGVLRITSRCRDTILGRCHVSFRIAVPDNVLVNVRTSSGRVHISGLNGSARVTTDSGAVAIDGFCGFTLVATSTSGPVSSAAECSPDRIELRSDSGNVRAAVPVGRYRVDAHSDRGTARVRGLTVADDAAFSVQAISGSGDVTVEGGR
jgi:putative adhesin